MKFRGILLNMSDTTKMLCERMDGIVYAKK